MFFNLKRISSSLLLRSFYLISIPIVLIQIIGIIVFFELHWDLVLKKMSNNIINNVELFINEYDHYTEVPYGMLQTLELVLIKDDEAKVYKDSKNYFVNKRMKQALKTIAYDSKFKTYDKDYFIIIINKNGNLFIREAFDQGASLAIVNKLEKSKSSFKQIKVKNSLKFLS